MSEPVDLNKLEKYTEELFHTRDNYELLFLTLFELRELRAEKENAWAKLPLETKTDDDWIELGILREWKARLGPPETWFPSLAQEYRRLNLETSESVMEAYPKNRENIHATRQALVALSFFRQYFYVLYDEAQRLIERAKE